jgi:hypothetical protein
METSKMNISALNQPLLKFTTSTWSMSTSETKWKLLFNELLYFQLLLYLLDLTILNRQILSPTSETNFVKDTVTFGEKS